MPPLFDLLVYALIVIGVGLTLALGWALRRLDRQETRADRAERWSRSWERRYRDLFAQVHPPVNPQPTRPALANTQTLPVWNPGGPVTGLRPWIDRDST